MTKQKEPIKHHYVPRAFLKAWANEKNRVNWSNIEKGISHDNDIYTIFYKKKLYKLSSSLETDFVTPFIDNRLFNDFRKLRENEWKSLEPASKENCIRYLITLNARNPKSIESMKKANLDRQHEIILENGFRDFIYIDDESRQEIISGFKNGNLFFMGIMIDELELCEEDFKAINNDVHKEIFLLFRSLIDIAKTFGTYKNSYSSMIIEKLPKLEVRELVIDTAKLITSNYPVIVNGINPEDGIKSEEFLILSNISPNKAILITSSQNILTYYDNESKNGKDAMVQFFNSIIKKKSSELVSKII